MADAPPIAWTAQSSWGLKQVSWELDEWADAHYRNLRRDLLHVTVHGAELRFLGTLRRYGGMTGSELAARLGVSRAATSILGKRLEAAGLVEARPDRRDRRRRIWTLTGEGSALLAKFEQRRASSLGSAWGRLTPEEQNVFLALLRRLAEPTGGAPRRVGRSGGLPARPAAPRATRRAAREDP
jgi:DNA-binding MarR family transcriptional regulator